MLDDWHQGFGTLAADWWSKFGLLLQFAAAQAVPLAGISFVVGVLALSERHDAECSRTPIWPLVAIGVLVSAITAVFYTSVGLIIPRISYPLIPALIVVVAAAALAVTSRNRARRELLAYFCVAIAIGSAAYTVLKNGPYS